MHIGVLSNTSDWSLDAAAMAKLVEAAGIESLFFGEHSHIPASRVTPYPGGDGTMPPGYERTLDLFVAPTMAATASTDLRLGTGICQIVQGDPILTAKAVASVDHTRTAEWCWSSARAGTSRRCAPRHRPGDARRTRGGARARDSGDLDRGRGDLPRTVRQLRPDLVVAEAGAERWLHDVSMTADEGQCTRDLERLLAVQAQFTGAA